MTYDVFISYSRKDTAIADRICAAFDKAGISYFIDRQEISGGMEFPTILAEAIDSSRLFLFIASENSYQSKFSINEVVYAFNEKPRNSLLPYFIDNSRMPKNLRLTFACINIRNIKEHPIDSVLVNDVLCMLGRRCQSPAQPQEYTQQELKELTRRGNDAYEAEKYDEATRLYKIAAEKGFAEAQYELGMMYLQGDGVPTSIDTGLHLITEAARQGYDKAQFRLGEMYWHGLYTEKDIEKASYWIGRAANQGNNNAKEILVEVKTLAYIRNMAKKM